MWSGKNNDLGLRGIKFQPIFCHPPGDGTKTPSHATEKSLIQSHVFGRANVNLSIVGITVNSHAKLTFDAVDRRNRYHGGHAIRVPAVPRVLLKPHLLVFCCTIALECHSITPRVC